MDLLIKQLGQILQVPVHFLAGAQHSWFLLQPLSSLWAYILV